MPKKPVDLARSLKVKANQAKAAAQRTYFAQLCLQCGLPAPTPEHEFCEGRKWRFDYAWPEYQVALEVEGGIWVKGAHTRGGHFLSDMEKYNTACLLGWRVLRCVPSTLLTLDTIALLRSAIPARLRAA